MDGPLDIFMEDEGSEDQVLITRSLSPPPLFRGWNRDPRYFSSGEPGIGGCQTPGLRVTDTRSESNAGGCRSSPPPPPLIGGSRQDRLSPLLRVLCPDYGGINDNPIIIGVGRTDHHIGPLEVAVTTGATTTMVSTVSYHLMSFLSDTVTSFSVRGNRCSGLTPKMSATLTVPAKAPPPPVGQVEAALDVLRRAGYPLPDYALHDSALEYPAMEL